MKKTIALLLAVMITLSVLPFSVSASRFDDVVPGKWYSKGIEFCDVNGYMAGVSDGYFDRNGTLTRAMFVTILASIEAAPTEYYQYNPCFSDVAVGKWYSGAVAWAYSMDLASGMGDGTFGYKNPVSREQIAVFMLAYAEYLNGFYGEAVDTEVRADLSVYSDSGRVHSWADEAMSWAVASGLISGTSDTTLDPRGNCTRAQAAIIISTFMLEINKLCEHDWQKATCTERGYCKNCHLFNTSYIAHSFGADKKCTACGAEYDPETGCGHNWKKDWCHTDSYCIRCGATKDDKTEHNFIPYNSDGSVVLCNKCGYWTCAEEHVWVEPTCLEDGYCEICYELGEKALGHKLDSDGVCVNCGGSYDEEDKCFHVWIMPDCENDGFCLVCLKTGELSDGHEFEDGECVNCGKRECKHSWTEPTCTKASYCTKCGETNPDKPAAGHSFINGVNMCRVCRIYKFPNFTTHQNVIQNIQIRGTTQSNGVKKFQNDFVSDSSTIHTFLAMKPDDNENVYATMISDSYNMKIESEITLSEAMTECPFYVKLVENGSTVFVVKGTAALESGELTVISAEYGSGYDEESVLPTVNLLVMANVLYAGSMLTEYCDVSLTDYGFEIGAIELS